MTQQKTFRRRVRARVEKTGESYTAARRMLLASGDRPETPAKAFPPITSETAVLAATGRGWDEWFSMLDTWGAVRKPHPEVARWLVDEHDTDGWWAQAITVSYERARGLRAPGQHADGWTVSATKTIAGPVQQVWDAWHDETERERWLPGAELSLRTSTAHRSARFDWEDGSTRLVVYFTEVSDAKSRVAVSHERLPDPDSAEEMKAWWRAHLATLKAVIEDVANGA